MMAQPEADGKPNSLACRLPGNANPAAGLQPVVSQTGRNCTVDKARFLGLTADSQIYEVACQGGPGLVDDRSRPRPAASRKPTTASPIPAPARSSAS